LQPHRLTDQLGLHARQRVGKLQADIPQQLFRRVAAGKQVAEPLHAGKHDRRTVLAAALIATQVEMLPEVFALKIQATDFGNQFCVKCFPLSPGRGV